jgi:hypothetical protein
MPCHAVSCWSQLQEELSRSRDVTRELRLRLKALEADLEAARSSSAATAAAGPGPGRGGGRRPAAADRCVALGVLKWPWRRMQGCSTQHAHAGMPCCWQQQQQTCKGAPGMPVVGGMCMLLYLTL